jgi:L-alanine-DL-glutamate epimerase-like enolase superfamily enzyme
MPDRECSNEIHLVALEAQVYRAPIQVPVQTAFGLMRDRPAVLVRAVADDGTEGWGEIWCNFPSVGAEHRARLLEQSVAPMVVGRIHARPDAVFREISRALHILAMQSGELGPIAQVIAGVDIALWDLTARRAGVPLYRLFCEQPVDRLAVYASGLNPDQPEKIAAERRAEGHRSFKLKVGFGRDRDLANLKVLRETLGDDCGLMIDANQSLNLDEAVVMAGDVEPFGLAWFEEPLRADAPRRHWRALARASAVPIAAGENIRGEDAFAEAIREGALQVLQPDIAKWGGFSGCVPVGRQALSAGVRFCPHWLGGGIGLAASMHLLAAAGGDGSVEIDANPNPLRSLMTGDLVRVASGTVPMPDAPGLGCEPNLKALQEFRVEF